MGQELAVANPLAKEIVDAVQLLGLDTVFEPGKLHPKDWSNPGRVRVLIKEGGRVRNRGVKNSTSIDSIPIVASTASSRLKSGCIRATLKKNTLIQPY